MERIKIIFDGIIDATTKEIFKQIDFFYISYNVFDFDINRRYKQISTMFVETISVPNNSQPITNGYFDIYPVSTNYDSPCKLRIISCRPELDIIYFQLSQFIQARFIIQDYPPSLSTLPLKELYELKAIEKKDYVPSTEPDLPDPDNKKRYGAEKNLSKNDVKKHIKRCRAAMTRGTTIEDYYDSVLNKICSLDTFKKWMKDKKFKEKIPQDIP